MKYPKPESQDVRDDLESSAPQRGLWIAANNSNTCLVMMITCLVMMIVFVVLASIVLTVLFPDGVFYD